MPDITMCNGKNCNLASTCLRYKATPSKYSQNYFTEAPIEDGKCDYYWETAEKRAENYMKLKRKE
jgi:hypothetical protein